MVPKTFAEMCYSSAGRSRQVLVIMFGCGVDWYAEAHLRDLVM